MARKAPSGSALESARGTGRDSACSAAIEEAASLLDAACSHGELLTMAQVGKVVAQITGRRKPHASVVHRWRTRGLCGVQLPTVTVLGRPCVPAEGLRDFIRQTSGGRVDLRAGTAPFEAVVANVLGRPYAQGGKGGAA